LALLDLADAFVDFNRQSAKGVDLMRGQTVVNLFFENSTRTSSSFEIAAKRLGADVVTMPVASSSVKKGETLIDTAVTLNAMKPEILVVRHASSGAVDLLSQKVGCAVVNAGDGRHEHPTQALHDLLSMRRALGHVTSLTVAICGDITHSRVARSNVALLQMMGARVRLIGPPTLVPGDADRWGCEVFHDIREGLQIECIACAACVDVCNEVMDKMNYPRGLVRYSTHHAIETQQPVRVLRPRVMIYGALLLALLVGFGTAIGNRSTLIVDIIRDRGALAREVEGRFIENTYQLQVINTAERAERFTVAVSGLPGLQVADLEALEVPATTKKMFIIRLRAPIEELTAVSKGSHRVGVLVSSTETPGVMVNERTMFFVPR
jgi:aspartate carbamoyltransferase catalytic subunit